MNKLIPLLVIAVIRSSGCAQENSAPNIIVMLTDDQRLNSLSCYDESIPIQTPHIDRLAGEGIRFDNGFVVSPICAVSRASIITGRYACNNSIHDLIFPFLKIFLGRVTRRS